MPKIIHLRSPNNFQLITITIPDQFTSEESLRFLKSELLKLSPRHFNALFAPHDTEVSDSINPHVLISRRLERAGINGIFESQAIYNNWLADLRREYALLELHHMGLPVELLREPAEEALTEMSMSSTPSTVLVMPSIEEMIISSIEEIEDMGISSSIEEIELTVDVTDRSIMKIMAIRAQNLSADLIHNQGAAAAQILEAASTQNLGATTAQSLGAVSTHSLGATSTQATASPPPAINSSPELSHFFKKSSKKSSTEEPKDETPISSPHR